MWCRKYLASVNDPLSYVFHVCECSVDSNSFLNLGVQVNRVCILLLYIHCHLAQKTHEQEMCTSLPSTLWGLFSANEELITMYEEHTALEVLNPSPETFGENYSFKHLVVM